MVRIAPDVPAGTYEVTAYVMVRPVELMHWLNLRVTAGSVVRTLNTSWFGQSGEYIPVRVRVRHRGGKLPVHTGFYATTGFDGMRGTRFESDTPTPGGLVDNVGVGGLGTDDEAILDQDDDHEWGLAELDGTPRLDTIDA
jgi:hypothetical protein